MGPKLHHPTELHAFEMLYSGLSTAQVRTHYVYTPFDFAHFLFRCSLNTKTIFSRKATRKKFAGHVLVEKKNTKIPADC